MNRMGDTRSERSGAGKPLPRSRLIAFGTDLDLPPRITIPARGHSRHRTKEA